LANCFEAAGWSSSAAGRAKTTSRQGLAKTGGAKLAAVVETASWLREKMRVGAWRGVGGGVGGVKYFSSDFFRADIL